MQKFEATWAHADVEAPSNDQKKLVRCCPPPLFLRILRSSFVWLIAAIVLIGIVVDHFVMLSNSKFAAALGQAKVLHGLDTSRNSVETWMGGGRRSNGGRAVLGRWSQKRGVLPGPGMSVPSSFHWTLPPGQHPPAGIKSASSQAKLDKSNFLALPVGIATALMRQRSKQEEKNGIEFTPLHHDSALQALQTEIPQAALSSQTHKNLLRMKKLLTLAKRVKVFMEKDPKCSDARNLLHQLRRVESMPRKYEDVMSYPFSSHLLYWGSFLRLQFDGSGVLFYKSGQAAYKGGWKEGRMEGEGSMWDEKGRLLWKGKFMRGLPVRTWRDYF
ncbi:hypothetical protein GUITHDRAFT_142199 [Guillardia theta CCMP2712]|uniref:Uncharacterized protein n=1 Tax=Guillardia theta (strain CCMP2712) TaxID=905079 RepID=L1IZ10_GUITC|nr:hypothetical protein GUITHDRAFT_142199 [Guillardia theta CCMP2712]EKX41297.1 hypothetical protein GUITHDRAFT_142199 [Guillardia theta CCMP2712]|eukprot:XP_005828277.1 hypothetical protein GUITHDRAFT_142199 [Guillardia theta CCMP2712]